MSKVEYALSGVRADLEAQMPVPFVQETDPVDEFGENYRVRFAANPMRRHLVDVIRRITGLFTVECRAPYGAGVVRVEEQAKAVAAAFHPIDQTLDSGTIVTNITIGTAYAESNAVLVCPVEVEWRVDLIEGKAPVPAFVPGWEDRGPVDPVAVRAALEALLVTPLPVTRAFDSVQPSGPHLRTVLTRDAVTSPYSTVRYVSGIFAIQVHTPIQDGVLPAEELADTIVGLYLPADRKIDAGVIIREVYAAPAFTGGGENGAGGPAWAVAPVFVEWRVNVLEA